MKNWHRDFLDVLRNYYSYKKSLDPKYSLRSLARDLDISPGPTSALIKGTRTWDFSSEWALGVISKMQLDPNIENRLRVKMGEPDIIPRTPVDPRVTPSLLSKWYYSDILTSFDLESSRRGHVEKLAKKLGLSDEEVRTAIDFLLDKRFLIRDEMGVLRRTDEALFVSEQVASEDVQKFHVEQLILSREALLRVPVEQRDFQTLTFAGSTQTVLEIKEEIRIFAEKIAILMSKSTENDEMFRFSIQLFPMNFKP